ncbi:glycosyltransferase [Alteromonas mediterranea]|uniref:glycosyltransferase n=1 Tax=Alteromonas mediterranea TaxID=314275 RepID=UPI0003557A0B|nr:glycosyltransferase [Alteromonas mediterranea]AGP85311.1 Glycosyl transferase group 1 [Alteromonas mediterranea U4]AGP89433.1 Glycosyl transferase group 1 [Alteromonas mediterranea U7]AGP93305.1 Glycosyl transferase group 1 [Alteromonas mediterranea U8]
MKRILIIINSIGYGGAERALVNILSQKNLYQDIEVHVLLLDDEPIVRELPQNVNLIIANSKRSLFLSGLNVYRHVKNMRPDLCVSFLVRANVCNAIVGKWVRRYPTVICERMHLSSHFDNQFSGVKRIIADIIPKICYRLADTALGVSTGVTTNLVNTYNVDKRRAATIFNPYPIKDIIALGQKSPEFSLPDEFVVSVGRLTKSKNTKLLINAFLASSEPAPLVVLGTGELQEELVEYISEKKVNDRVMLLGYAKNPYAVVSRAKYYISASTNEGFPNALLEAMVLGKAVIMSDCPSGPAEILAGSYTFTARGVEMAEYGVLVPLNSSAMLTEAINCFQTPEVVEHYTKQSKLRSFDYSIEKIANDYWTLFKKKMC